MCALLAKQNVLLSINTHTHTDLIGSPAVMRQFEDTIRSVRSKKQQNIPK